MKFESDLCSAADNLNDLGKISLSQMSSYAFHFHGLNVCCHDSQWFSSLDRNGVARLPVSNSTIDRDHYDTKDTINTKEVEKVGTQQRFLPASHL